MRQAKQNFDNLVSRVKSGEKISFGQMEKVYAEGFLQIFLERTKKQRENALEELRKQMEESEEYYDEDKIHSKQSIDKQEIDYLRNIVGILGVKPKIEQLRTYTERAINERNWGQLSDVLSISLEGNLSSGNLETLALNELEKGSMGSYRELKEQFPGIELGTDKINEIYATLLSSGNLSRLVEVIDATKVSVSDMVCQNGYLTFLSERNKGAIKMIHNLKEITGINPEKTEEVREIVGRIYGNPNSDFCPRDLDELDNLFGVYSDPNLSVSVQESALGASRIFEFMHLWNRSDAKVSEEDVKGTYTNLDNAKMKDVLVHLIRTTKVSPSHDVYSRVASYELDVNGLEGLESLVGIVGETPELDQDKVDGSSEELAKLGKLDSMVMLSKLGGEIKQEYLHGAAFNFLKYGDANKFDSLEQRVNEFYQTFGLQSSLEVSSMRFSKALEVLNENIEESVYEFSDESLNPLKPRKGANLGKCNRFRSKIRSLLKEYVAKAKEIKGEVSDVEIKDFSVLDHVYSACLETNLAQIHMGGKKYLGLDKLVETTGVPIKGRHVSVAVYNHIVKNSYDPGLSSKKITKSGLDIEIDAETHNQVASNIVLHLSNIEGGLSYLKEITGIKRFSERVHDAARQRLVKELSKADTSRYETLKKLKANMGRLSYREKETASRGLVSSLMGNPSIASRAEEIVENAKLRLQASDWELSTMIRKYFEQSCLNVEPWRIANLVNQKLDVNQIYEQEIKLIHEGQLESAKKLYKNTGISPSKDETRILLRGYNDASQKEMKRRLNFVFEQNSGLV